MLLYAAVCIVPVGFANSDYQGDGTGNSNDLLLVGDAQSIKVWRNW